MVRVLVPAPAPAPAPVHVHVLVHIYVFVYTYMNIYLCLWIMCMCKCPGSSPLPQNLRLHPNPNPNPNPNTDTLGEVLRASFLFWQRGTTSPAGKAYIQMYNLNNGGGTPSAGGGSSSSSSRSVGSGASGGAPIVPNATNSIYPHISIIDPRTGAKVWTVCGYLEPDELTQQLITFIEMHDLAGAMAPTPNTVQVRDLMCGMQRDATQCSACISCRRKEFIHSYFILFANPPLSLPLPSLSPQAAVTEARERRSRGDSLVDDPGYKASATNTSGAAVSAAAATLSAAGTGQDSAEADAEADVPSPSPSPTAAAAATVDYGPTGPEPPTGPDVCRVQFKYMPASPAGAVVVHMTQSVRRFNKTATLSELFAAAQHELAKACSDNSSNSNSTSRIPFALSTAFPAKELCGVGDAGRRTLEEEGLCGSQVMLRLL